MSFEPFILLLPCNDHSFLRLNNLLKKLPNLQHITSKINVTTNNDNIITTNNYITV